MASSSPLGGSSATSTVARLSLSAADMLTMMLVVLQLKPFRYLQLLISCMAVLTKINANHAHSPQVRSHLVTFIMSYLYCAVVQIFNRLR
jgi:hypothetical protein